MKFLTVAAVVALLSRAAQGQHLSPKAKYNEGNFSGHKQHATTQTCPKGYYFEGSRCVSKQEVAPELSCPSGSVERDGQCFDFSAGRWTCSNDLSLIGKTCIGREYTDKIRACPEGSIPRGGECVVLGDYPFECPDDSVMENGRCALIKGKFRKCPDGFKEFGDLCVHRESTEPLRHCPTGTINENNRCTITTTVEKVCPSGYEDVAGHCVAYHDEVQRCPDGYRPAGSWCMKTDRVEKTIQCVNGQDPSNNCAVDVDVPLTPVCTTGKMWNGQCAHVSSEPALYSCPAGYDLRGNSCVKTVPYDCSTTEHDIVCEEPAQGKDAHLRSLAPEGLKTKYKTAEYGKRHPLPVCHKVPRTVPKTCERTISAQGEAYCASGVLKAGNMCELTAYTAPEYKCDATSGPAGQCFVTETSAPLRACPTGYTNTGNQCIKTLTASPEWRCPRNTSGPDCTTTTEKVCLGGDVNCQTTIIEPAKYICPEGYKKLRATGKCEKLTFADKVLTCPVNAEERDGLTCAEYLKGKIEDFVRKIQEQRTCPAGYADNGSNCVRRVIQPASFVCPGEATADSSYSCVTPVPKISACPKGSTLRKDKCWVISTTQAITVDTVVGSTK